MKIALNLLLFIAFGILFPTCKKEKTDPEPSEKKLLLIKAPVAHTPGSYIHFTYDDQNRLKSFKADFHSVGYEIVAYDGEKVMKIVEEDGGQEFGVLDTIHFVYEGDRITQQLFIGPSLTTPDPIIKSGKAFKQVKDTFIIDYFGGLEDLSIQLLLDRNGNVTKALKTDQMYSNWMGDYQYDKQRNPLLMIPSAVRFFLDLNPGLNNLTQHTYSLSQIQKQFVRIDYKYNDKAFPTAGLATEYRIINQDTTKSETQLEFVYE